jgi:hypothetical protein
MRGCASVSMELFVLHCFTELTATEASTQGGIKALGAQP